MSNLGLPKKVSSLSSPLVQILFLSWDLTLMLPSGTFFVCSSVKDRLSRKFVHDSYLEAAKLVDRIPSDNKGSDLG